MKIIKTAFFGTPEFSVESLELLHHSPLIDLKVVVTMPDRPAGRGKKIISPPVADFAKNNNIPLIQTENINHDPLAITKLRELDLDFILVIAFAQFLGNKILTLPKIGCFNIHTSLLPKYRGAAPIQYAILNGDTETGVSIQKMVKKMDAGDIAFLTKVNIDKNETSSDLFLKLQNHAAISLEQFIPLLIKNEITYQKQDESKVSFAPAIKKSEGYLDFETMDASSIYNKIRAFYPWPGTFTFINDKRVKVLKAVVGKENIHPGKLDTKFGTLSVGCKSNSIRLETVQLEGRKACSDKELINGLKNKFDKLEITKGII